MDATEISIYNGIVVASIATAALLMFFFLSVIRMQRHNMVFQRQYSRARIDALEHDRARIAVDLHDDLGPLLSAVKFRLASIVPSSEAERTEITRSKMILDDAIARIRSISHNLMPDTLVRKGLTTAIREFIDLIDNQHTIDFTLRANESLEINESRCVNIYRIVQEVIYNAVKHSHASDVHIEMEMKREKLFIRISDNGKGFDYKKKIKEGTGMGLASLSGRTMIGEGKMHVRSTPGKGTAYLFEMPV